MHGVVWMRVVATDVFLLPCNKEVPLTVALSRMKSRDNRFDICEQYLQHNGVFVARRPRRRDWRLVFNRSLLSPSPSFFFLHPPHQRPTSNNHNIQPSNSNKLPSILIHSSKLSEIPSPKLHKWTDTELLLVATSTTTATTPTAVTVVAHDATSYQPDPPMADEAPARAATMIPTPTTPYPSPTSPTLASTSALTSQ